MTDLKRFFASVLLVLTHSIVFGKTAQCPADSAAIPYHSLAGGSQVALSVLINHSGPYDFMLDTGAQVTVIDPRLAAELNLRPQGSIGVVSLLNYASADLVKPELVEAGPAAVRDLPMAVQGLAQLQAANPKLRGILGENFLGRFDLLIDYGHKMICLDQTREMQKQLQGERVPMIEQAEQSGNLAFAERLLVTVHLQGDGKKGTVLKIDSGSNVPMLFENRLESAWWLQLNHARRGSVAGKGGAPMFATMPSQEVQIGSHMTRQIAFLSPISAEHTTARADQDGLLSTAVFKSVFISYADHLVIFDPR
jgi:hypothetical protein